MGRDRERRPRGALRLKARQFLDGGTAARFRQRFADAGLSPDRVEIEGRRTFAEGFAEYSTIDVALDPFPYHGTTSTCEALWMAVPVVTLPGRTCVSRVGPSLLARVGLDDLAARDEAHYHDIAVGLIGEPARLAEMRRSPRGIAGAIGHLRRAAVRQAPRGSLPRCLAAVLRGGLGLSRRARERLFPGERGLHRDARDGQAVRRRRVGWACQVMLAFCLSSSMSSRRASPWACCLSRASFSRIRASIAARASASSGGAPSSAACCWR